MSSPADRYEVRYRNGSWFILKDGQPLSPFGYDDEWEAIASLKAYLPGIGREVERRHLCY